MKIKIEIEISNLKSERQNFGGKNRKLDKMVNLLQGTSENFEFFKLFSKGNKWRLLYYPDLNRIRCSPYFFKYNIWVQSCLLAREILDIFNYHHLFSGQKYRGFKFTCRFLYEKDWNITTVKHFFEIFIERPSNLLSGHLHGLWISTKTP